MYNIYKLLYILFIWIIAFWKYIKRWYKLYKKIEKK